MGEHPPDIEDFQTLADSFDETDITELEGLELISKKPERQRLAEVDI